MLWILIVLSAHKKVTLQCTVFSLFCCVCRFRSFEKPESATKRLDLMPGVLFLGQNYATWQLFICEEIRNLKKWAPKLLCAVKERAFH
jgi:hypothetical protein